MELGDDNLKQTVAGKTVNLDTPFGVSIPITYHGNGLMSGKAGVLEYFLGAEADRGKWWVANGKLCQKWFKWLDAQPSCMQLKQDGDKILWRRDDGLTGTATIASALPPGADSAPHGLGGPIQPPQPGPSLAADPPEKPAKTVSASIASLPPLHRAPKAAAPKAVAAIAPLPPPPEGDNFGGESRLDLAPVAQEVAFAAGLGDQWCRAEAAADAAPQLALVTRFAYSGGEVDSPLNACLATEPPLQQLARIGVNAR